MARRQKRQKTEKFEKTEKTERKKRKKKNEPNGVRYHKVSDHLQQRDGHISLDSAVGAFPRKLKSELVKFPELLVLHEAEVERRNLFLQLNKKKRKSKTIEKKKKTSERDGSAEREEVCF